MNYFNLTTLILGILLFKCNQANSEIIPVAKEKLSILSDDKEQIRSLIRQVLNWAESGNTINLFSVTTDRKNRVNVGFNLYKHRQNLDKLRQTGLFSDEFIENYNKIILTLDRKIKANEFEKWMVGDLPSFNFANGVNPWCGCQDVPYDKPNPSDFVGINIISLNNNKGEVNWYWGGLKSDTDPSWKRFSYKFRVVKQNGRWKIAYLEGFDFKISIAKSGN